MNVLCLVSLKVGHVFGNNSLVEIEIQLKICENSKAISSSIDRISNWFSVSKSKLYALSAEYKKNRRSCLQRGKNAFTKCKDGISHSITHK